MLEIFARFIVFSKELYQTQDSFLCNLELATPHAEASSIFILVQLTFISRFPGETPWSRWTQGTLLSIVSIIAIVASWSGLSLRTLYRCCFASSSLVTFRTVSAYYINQKP